MKQKTVFITLALIVAILALGVAYAAISNQTLTIEGNATATASEGNFDVKFTGTPTTGGEGTVQATLDGSDSTGRKAKMVVTGLTTKGDAATATFTITNNSNVDAGVDALVSAVISGQSNTEWFTVTHDLDDDTEIKAGASTTITVTVTLNETIVDADELESFTVTITAKPQ